MKNRYFLIWLSWELLERLQALQAGKLNGWKKNKLTAGEKIILYIGIKERRKNMKTVEIMKWGKGYYVTKREGCNVQREWCKTKKDAEALQKKWSA